MSQPGSSIGITRNLTEVFVLLRNNAQQNKFIYGNGNASRNEEKLSLVALEEGNEHRDSEQPMWIHTSDEVEFEFGRIRSRLEELEQMQKRHLSKPNIGDENFEEEEKQMEAMTEQITSMLGHCQRLIGLLRTQSVARESSSEHRLRENAISALLLTLSDITNNFRSRQTNYLKRIKSRTNHLDSYLVTSGQTDEPSWDQLVDLTPTKEYSMVQLQQIMNNEIEVRQRENEVLAVNSSIRELNHLFKDVSQMIIDQGTILDRIDYNVEQASIRVNKAVASVEKAEKYQRNDKKMHCICFLAAAILLVLLFIVLKKAI
ncbi:unnamed protein product, partial [Mesorhabditis belari]|uniref:t-SNARE coiled-coil homology domain-containing protein n=1 Tax=Mesorhabditis belari TaxID=2138241 RepID=A0AAF3EA98_9BILA